MQKQAGYNGKDLGMPILLLVAIAVYIPSIFAGITRLDDYVFVYKFNHYYSHYYNLITSFSRGVFGGNDHFYRPLLTNSFLLNYRLAHTNLWVYHLVNIALHAGATLLLYLFFIELRTNKRNSLLLALLFCVHPISVQAVSWLPGRNETLLAIFVLLYLISNIRYSNTGKFAFLFFSFLSLLAAFFTKETGLFAVPVYLVIHVFFQQKHITDVRLRPIVLTGIVAYVIWGIARSNATVHAFPLSPGLLIRTFSSRWVLVLQYVGKVFLPVNQSVFPSIKDTSIWPGVAASIFLGIFVYKIPNKDRLKAISGVGIFLLFLVPAMIVPDYMSVQAFEHRLYLPMIGLLLVIAQSAVLSNSTPSKLQTTTFAALFFAFTALNLSHQRNFKNPLMFWKQAAETSPSSGYAHILLALQQPDPAMAFKTIHEAEKINGKEHHINYYKGLLYIKYNYLDSAKTHMLREQQLTGYYECNFHLARVAFKEGNVKLAREYYTHYLATSPNIDRKDLSDFQLNYPLTDTIKLATHFKKLLQ